MKVEKLKPQLLQQNHLMKNIDIHSIDGAQMLIAAGLTALNPIAILPYLYYPFVLGIVALLSILFRYPRRYS